MNCYEKSDYDAETWHSEIDQHLPNQIRVNRTIVIDAWGLYQLLDTEELEVRNVVEYGETAAAVAVGIEQDCLVVIGGPVVEPKLINHF